MKQSKLETERITFKDIVEEIKYVGLGHYLDDLVGVLMGDWNMHYHKKHHTNPKSLFLHSYISDLYKK